MLPNLAMRMSVGAGDISMVTSKSQHSDRAIYRSVREIPMGGSETTEDKEIVVQSVWEGSF